MKKATILILTYLFFAFSLLTAPLFGEEEYGYGAALELSRTRCFLPPKTVKALRLPLPSKEGHLGLAWNDQHISLKIPASEGEKLEILFPRGSVLLSVHGSPSLLGQMEIVAPCDDSCGGNFEDEGLLPRSGKSFFIALDHPEQLICPLTWGGQNSQRELSIENSREVKISAGGKAFSVSPSQERRTFRFSPREAPGTLWYIHPLSSISYIKICPAPIPEAPLPLLRDSSQILNTRERDWRQRDYEIYRWALFPNVLIFDFRNYEVQQRFFRRLAFFAEKKGFRGKILSNAQLKGRHGWNAHDYSAPVLAKFFNAAAVQKTVLNREELLLKDLLLEAGCLRQEPGGRLQAENAAVLSISRESAPSLRSRFLVHESSHGIYFTRPEYRRFVKKLWLDMAEEDRALWRLFLGWYGYDPKDEDLMINEFQAYSIQQKAFEAPGYFSPRLRALTKAYPAQRGLLERGIGQNSRKFGLWAETLSRELERKWGISAGDSSGIKAIKP